MAYSDSCTPPWLAGELSFIFFRFFGLAALPTVLNGTKISGFNVLSHPRLLSFTICGFINLTSCSDQLVLRMATRVGKMI